MFQSGRQGPMSAVEHAIEQCRSAAREYTLGENPDFPRLPDLGIVRSAYVDGGYLCVRGTFGVVQDLEIRIAV